MISLNVMRRLEADPAVTRRRFKFVAVNCPVAQPARRETVIVDRFCRLAKRIGVAEMT